MKGLIMRRRREIAHPTALVVENVSMASAACRGVGVLWSGRRAKRAVAGPKKLPGFESDIVGQFHPRVRASRVQVRFKCKRRTPGVGPACRSAHRSDSRTWNLI